MKLVWESGVLVPVLLLLPVLVQGQTCPDGIAGINAKDIVCCPLECGTCAGKGCTGRPGGANSCCGIGIRATQGLCSETGEAPCNLVDPNPESAEDSEDGFSGGQYGKEYSGDATYYGFTTAGNCAFFDNVPQQYDGMIPVALNNAQYGDSLMCGACIEGTASGNGSGRNPIPSTFKAFVTDKCPECDEGDLDFSMSGDGRWDIEWKFVACPGEDLSFVSPSANPYYMKVQPRGTKTPIETLKIAGQTATRTQDNHFVVENNSGSAWPGTQSITTKTVGGDSETTTWTFF